MKKTIILIVTFLLVIILFFSQFGFQIGNVRIGKQVDLITRQDKNFEKSNFYKKYYSSDKLVVLNVWATWCQPCLEEVPLLNKIKSNYSNQNIDFISMSIDTDSIKLLKFNNKGFFKFNDLTFMNLKYRTAILNTLEGRKTDEYISTQSVPITYLIKNKKVISKIDGTIDEDELVELIRKNK